MKNDGSVDASVQLFERKDQFSRTQMQKEQRRRSVASLAQLHDGESEAIEEHELSWSVPGETRIKVGGKLDIVVSFTPNVAGRYCGMLEVCTRGGTSEFIQYKADVSALSRFALSVGLASVPLSWMPQRADGGKGMQWPRLRLIVDEQWCAHAESSVGPLH